MIFNVGNGSKKPFAFIHAEYPKGSQCICTNGLKTVKASWIGERDYRGNYIQIIGNDAPAIESLSLYGKSSQDGTPTPSNPIPIASVENPVVTASGKNLIYHISNVTGSSGATVTANDDGTFTLSGPSKSATYAVVLNSKVDCTHLAGRQVRLSLDGASDGVYLVAFFYAENGTTRLLRVQTGSDNTVTFDVPAESKKMSINCGVPANTEVTSMTLSPMLCYADFAEAWVAPMDPQTVNLTHTLRGVPVLSGGNYTDDNGQRWIADVLRVRADGSGEIEKRCGSYAVTTNTPGNAAPTIGSGIYYFAKSVLDGVMIPNVPNGRSAMVLNTLGFQAATNINNLADNCCTMDGTSGTTIYFRMNSATSYGDALSNLVDAGTEIIYPLEIPTTEQLSADEVQQILGLKTHSPATVISNDQDATMDVSISGGGINSANFSIPYAGLWTVSCSEGSEHDHKNVYITEKNQIASVLLQYRMTPKFTYTGNFEIVDDNDNAIADFATWKGNWKIRFLTSGTFTVTNLYGGNGIFDAFLVGGGGGSASSYQQNGSGGGAGGFTQTRNAIEISVGIAYPIAIGAGGDVNVNGGETSFNGIKAAGGNAGGNGGSGYSHNSGGHGGSGGGYGYNGYSGAIDGYGGTKDGFDTGHGQRTHPGPNGETGSTREFGEPGGRLYSTGGNSRVPSTAEIKDEYHGLPTYADNSGDGGDGSASSGTHYGRSGIVIIRNAREVA